MVGYPHHVRRYYGPPIKTPVSRSLNPNRRILTWTLSSCQNFMHPLLRRCRHRHRHPVHLHAITVTGFMPSPPSARPSPPLPRIVLSRCSSTAVVPLLLRHCRRCPIRTASQPSSSLSSSAISVVPGTKPPPPPLLSSLLHPGTSPSAWPSPPPGPHHHRIHLQQFGKPSPSLFSTASINSILLCLDVCLYEYASKLINLSFVSMLIMPMMIFHYLLI
jgi:hypothetical protein